MEGVLIIIILIFLHGVVLSQAQGQLYDETYKCDCLSLPVMLG